MRVLIDTHYVLWAAMNSKRMEAWARKLIADLDNDILVPFAGSETRTIDSPISLRGVDKVQPRMPPSVGQHTDDVLKEAGYDATAIAQMRAAGAVG